MFPTQKLSNTRPTWDIVFMNICETVAKRSTCVRIQTAAILVKDFNIISIGYNGCCPKMEHCVDFWYKEYLFKYKSQGTWDAFLQSDFFYKAHHDYSTRNEIHGELNAIINAAKNNSSSEHSTMYTLYAPCINCAKLIVASRVKRVVYKNLYKRDQAGLEFLVENKVAVQALV